LGAIGLGNAGIAEEHVSQTLVCVTAGRDTSRQLQPVP
jgi:hypothetical protein